MADSAKSSLSTKTSMTFNFFKKPSKVYIVEFLIMHVALLVILFSGSALFNKIIDQTKEAAASFDLVGAYTSILGVNTTILAVAYGLVSTVVFWWLYSRTSKAEANAPKLVVSRRRRLLQYIFLSITGLLMFGYTVSITYTVLLEVFGEGASEFADEWWRSVIKTGFALALAASISYLVASNVDPKGESK